MFRRPIACVLAFLVALLIGHRPAEAGGLVTTPLQTRSIPMIQTDWGDGTSGITDPLVFQRFDPSLGTLEAVFVTMKTTSHSDFTLIFPATPTETTLYVATTATTDPSILADPTKVQQLTDGPTVTLKGPDGTTSLFGAPGTTVPVDVISLKEPSGKWSSLLPVTDPHYIAPDNVKLDFSRTIDASEGSLMASFVGKGMMDLPAAAVAHSSFYSSSGNGSGLVLTSVAATVTVQYSYRPFAPQSVPEPSGLALLGLGAGLGGLLVSRSRR